MAKTLQQAFAIALGMKGEHEIKRLHKSWVYTHKEGGCHYIGKSGSLRFGRNKVNSIPCSDKFKAELKEMMK